MRARWTPGSHSKAIHRKLWAAGDYADVARLHAPPGRDLGSLLHANGAEALDVATGTGNTAILRARVVGVDLSPELLAVAEVRGRSEGVEVEWIEGDAEALPFEDDRFDLVVSTFGVGWAPDHETAARQLLRVLKPGGMLGLCHWSASGIVGRSLQVIPQFLPPSPDASRAWLRGDEQYVRSLFAGIDFECELAATRCGAASSRSCLST